MLEYKRKRWNMLRNVCRDKRLHTVYAVNDLQASTCRGCSLFWPRCRPLRVLRDEADADDEDEDEDEDDDDDGDGDDDDKKKMMMMMMMMMMTMMMMMMTMLVVVVVVVVVIMTGMRIDDTRTTPMQTS